MSKLARTLSLLRWFSLVLGLTAFAVAQTNIAPSGTAYGWKANTSSTANTNRTAQAGLNDGNLTTGVDLDSAGDAVNAWEAAGVVWSSAASISSVNFINGTITSGGDGFLTANCKLQFSTDGTTWTDSGWTISPAYPNSSAAGGQTYTFSGTAVSGKLGARVTGQVRTADTSYHWIVNEVRVTGTIGTNYTITASAGTGGTISPSGAVSVAQAANQTFTIAANSGYAISAVTVDGTSVGAVSSYTFSNVQANHTISASFVASGTTITVATGFYNQAITTQVGQFTAQFDASPSLSPINACVSLSQSAVTAYTGMATVARFNPTGDIDARNGGAYAAATTIPYSANTNYHFRLVIDVPAHTYSIYVTPAGGSEITVGTNYAFRAEQAGVTQLDNWNADVNTTPGGSIVVSNFSVTQAQVAAPTFSPAAGTYAGAQSVTIGSATPGASVRYTTDGSTPTATVGTLYTGAITVGSSETLKAIAYAAGMIDSNVTSGAYTITAPPPDFSLTATPSSATAAPGGSASYTASVSGANGFAGTVGFGVTGLPAGATATFSPTTVMGSGSTTVTVTTSTSTPAGSSTLTITGTSGTLTHSTNVTLVVSTPSWVHPGVGLTKPMLDYSKAQAAAGVEPWASALTKMVNDTTYGPLSYTPVPWQTVECGSSSNPNYGCSDERRDSMAAYTQALLWYFTGNHTYADNAIKIMNAWSSTLTGGHTNSNAPLQTGWTGSVWPRAAEIITTTNAGWSATDVAAFKHMLTTQYLPYVINGGCQNGNWEAVELLAVMNIAIFTEDATSYNKGVTLWQGRLPAYIYLTSDGSSPLAPGHCSLPSWYGLTTFVNGVAQETCRDFGHCEWGIEGLLLAAETDRAQAGGSHYQNLYAQLDANSRFFNAYEFHCTYLNGATAPSWLCSGAPTLGYVQCFEAGYNHLVNRHGYSMPQTAQYLNTKRPTGVSYFIGWETMTYYGQGNR